jgi:hypothetical protein
MNADINNLLNESAKVRESRKQYLGLALILCWSLGVIVLINMAMIQWRYEEKLTQHQKCLDANVLIQRDYLEYQRGDPSTLGNIGPMPIHCPEL